MKTPFTQLGPRIRLGLARRPWIRWVIVVAIAGATGLTVAQQLARVDAARESWTTTQEVAVAARDHAPGDPIEMTRIELPIAALAPTAVTTPEPDARARQHIASGEVIVAADLTVGIGPAAGAADDTVVVPVSDPLVVNAPIGAAVAIYSDGLVLADSAEIVAVDLDVAFIAVDPADAPLVAAAAQLRSASIVFTR